MTNGAQFWRFGRTWVKYGNLLLTSWKLCSARPHCFMLLTHWVRAAASRTFWTAGRSSPIRMAMMAMTTSSSISVKPDRRRGMLNPPTKNETKRGGTQTAPNHAALVQLEVEGRFPRLYFLGEGGFRVVLGGDQFFRVLAGQAPRLGGNDGGVGHRDLDGVIAWLQSLVGGDAKPAVGDGGSRMGVDPGMGDELDAAVIDGLSLVRQRTGDGEATAGAGPATAEQGAQYQGK